MTATTGQVFSFLQFMEGKEKKTFPLYFLEGEDEFLIREAVNKITGKILTGGMKEFNFSRIKGEKTLKASEVYAVCMELPVMAPTRVVYLEDIGKVASEERDRLAKFLEGGIKGTILLISSVSSSFQKGKNPAGKKLEALIKERGAHVQCEMGEKEIEEWSISSMRLLGFEMKQDAAHLLRRRIGPDLWMIDIELKKLRAFCGVRKIVTRQDVEAISTYTPQAQMYQLTEHIVKGDVNGALKIFHELIFQSDPSLGILNYINRFFLGILEVQKSFQETGSVRESARILRKAEYVVKKNLEVASRLKEHHLQRIMELLLQADLGIKRGKEKRILFETLIVHLCMVLRG